MGSRGKKHDRQAKRLLKQIRYAQYADKFFHKVWMYSVRYLVPFTMKPRLAIMCNPNLLEPMDYHVPKSAIPLFFRSQLEHQQLIAPDSPTVHLSPLLQFVLQSIPKKPEKGYPITFRSFSRTRQRTHQIFAFVVAFMMPARYNTYAIRDLISMRDDQASSDEIRQILDKDASLVNLVPSNQADRGSAQTDRGHTQIARGYTQPDRGYNQVDRGSAQADRESSRVEQDSTSRANTVRHKKSSSTSSDEVLFKGRAHQRQQAAKKKEEARKQLAGEASESLANESLPSKSVGKKSAVGEGSSQSANMSENMPSAPVDIWAYRGRSVDQKDLTQPIGPPTTGMCQGNEGFQRFFKAVKSPDHVRVTAGGRIVPNTRRTVDQLSPVSKKRPYDFIVPNASLLGPVNKENRAGSSADIHGEQPAESGTIQPSVVPPMVVVTQFNAPAPAGYRYCEPPAGMYPEAPPGYRFLQMVPILPQDTEEISHQGNTGDASSKQEASSPKKADQVTPTPAIPYDPSRHFMFNAQGQFMVPAMSQYGPAPGGFMTPQSMLGMPHAGYQHMNPMMNNAAHPGMMYPYMGMPSYGAQSVMSAMSSGYMNPAAVMPDLSQRPRAPVPAPTSSSTIKMSSITQNHIANFRESLAYLQNQLIFNRHQIDENHINSEIQRMKENIKIFEAQLVEHLKTEAAQEAGAGAHAKVAVTPVEEAAVKETHVKEASVEDSDDSDDTASSTSDKAEFKHVEEKESGDKKPTSTLPSYAAKAAPFEPREGPYMVTSSSDESSEEDVPELTPIGKLASKKSCPKMTPKAVSQEMMVRTRDWIDNSGTKVHPESPYLKERFSLDNAHMSRPLSETELRAREEYWNRSFEDDSSKPGAGAAKVLKPILKKKKDAGSAPAPKSPAPRYATPNGKAKGKSFSDLDPFRSESSVPPVGTARGELSETAVPSATMRGHKEASAPKASASIKQKPKTVGTEKVPHKGLRRSSGQQVHKINVTEPAKTVLSPCENSTETAASQDRRAEKTGGARVFGNVLKKSGTSSALSSTTAHALRPKYAGNAAASLGPSMAKGTSPHRETEAWEAGTALESVNEELEENRPL